MKRRKLNILLSVFSIVLSFSLFGFGVYASAVANSTINNTFVYEVPPEDFYVNVIGSITGCQEEQNFTNFLTHDKDSLITEYPNQYDVNFVELSANTYKDIVFSFTVTNYNAFPITAHIESDTNSTYFTSVPSQQVTIDAYSFNGENYVADCDVVTLTLKLNSNTYFEKEPNIFKIVFSKVEN